MGTPIDEEVEEWQGGALLSFVMANTASRVTIEVDAALVEEAKSLLGIRTNEEVGHRAVECLIARESARRLIALGGTLPNAQHVPRRRPRSVKRRGRAGR